MRSTLYEPFVTMRRLQDEMNRAFGNAQSGTEDSSHSAVSQWSPAVDVHEEKDRFRIVADVPGVAPEDIEITLENGVLTISGERRAAQAPSGEGSARRVERVYGAFFRRFSLPDTTDGDAVEARCHHGELEICIPKKALPKAQKIKVAH